MTRSAQRLPRRHAVLPAVAIAVALTFGVSACASAEQTADAMHSSVVQIAERAVAGDFVGALAELELLDRDVTVALDAGSIDADREQVIRAAIDLVRADLEAALAAATPSPAPAPDDDDEGDDGDGNGNGNENGGNSGNGNGNGNGGGSGSGDSTEPPATAPPATEPPVTEPPVTEPPTTEPPATDPPDDEGEG
ncbi:hypothetical protein [Agromyces albus]|uniref:hypothetical protein n=1 Tax=Agromyces albus TaxID=205332 RepID=UPI0027898202|nr:hypothetical protein [Agromyces albus]MDQ0577014.1 putative membrane protein YgcG [Agromyces albus]